MSHVTQILLAIEQGDPKAAEDLLPLVYHELRKLAAARLAQEKPGLTLQATALVHPNIAKVLDAGATNSGRPYFVMELVKGIAISEYCDEQHFTPRERLELFVRVCQAVQHAHQKGIIHRDLKPSNVLVAEYDHQAVPKIIDFGVAKATSQKLTEKTMFTQYGQIVGTLEYMSPEQAKLNQLDIDTRSDVYALGVLLYHLLTGTTPFERERLQSAAFEEMLRIIREEEPPKPSTRISTLGNSAATRSSYRRTSPQKLQKMMRGELDWIVMRCLEKERNRRYESAASFAADIERFLNGEAVHACPPSTTYRMRKFARRYKAVTATVALVAISIVLGLLGTSWQALRATLAEGIAEQKRIEAERESTRARLESNRAVAAEKTARDHAQRAAAKSRELEKQLRISNATGLAAQARAVRPQSPIRGLLLAVESINLTWEHDRTVTPIAHETLLNTLPMVAGRPLRGHEDGVDRVASSPDGQWLATAAWRTTDGIGEVRLWNLGGDDPAASPRILRGHQGDINELIMSSDSHWLVTGSADGTARLWDLTDSAVSSIELAGHQRGVSAVAMSPDCRWLVTGSWGEGIARLWDLSQSDPHESSLELKFSYAFKPTFSPDSRWLVAPSDEGEIRLTNLSDEAPSAHTILAGAASSVAISPDSRWIASLGNSNALTDVQALRLWDLNASDLASSSIELSGHTKFIRQLVFSSDSHWFITGSEDHTALVWNLTDGHGLRPLVLKGHEAGILSLAVSRDGRWLATGSSDTTARLWELGAADPRLSSRVLWGHRGGISEVAFSPDGRWLATASDDGKARLWNLSTAQVSVSSRELKGHDGSLSQSLVMDPKGRWLVTHGMGDTVPRLWDLLAGNPTNSSLELTGHRNTRSLAVSSNSRWLLSASENAARLWDISGEDPPYRPVVDLPHTSSASPRLSANNRWLVTVDGETVHLWDLSAEEPFSSSTKLRHQDSVDSLVFTLEGDHLVTGSGRGDDYTSRGETRIWDLRATDPVSASVVFPGQGGPNWRLATSSNGRWLVTAWRNAVAQISGPVRLWNLNSKDWSATPHTLTSGKGFRAISISPNNRWLIVGGTDGAVRTWELTEQGPSNSPIELINTKRRYTLDHIWVGIWSPDSRWLVTAGDHGIIRLWDFAEGIPNTPAHMMHGHETGNRWGFVRSAAISPDGRWLVTGSANEARLWDLSAENPGDSSVVLRHGGETTVTITPNGRWIVTAVGDALRLWDPDIDTLRPGESSCRS